MSSQTPEAIKSVSSSPPAPFVEDQATDANRRAAALSYHILEKITAWPTSEQARGAELLTTLADQVRPASQTNSTLYLI